MRVLVAYGSKHGSTAEIAEAIAGTLRGGGLEADCEDAGEVASLEGYDAVVLGSALYMKRWRREAKRFLSRHEDALEKLPFWVFGSGPVGEPDPEKEDPDWLEPPAIIDRIEALGVREHVVFGGNLDPDRGGPMVRMIARSTPPEHLDRRDWDEIESWARGIAAELED